MKPYRHTRTAGRRATAWMAGLAVLLLGMFLSAPPAGAAGIDPLEFDSPAQEQRYKDLIAELRCLVCQNQSLSESDADLAKDLRREVFNMMKSGSSNEEIIGFLVARYGDFVLYRPPFKPVTVLLWFAPLLLALAAIWLLVQTLRRRGQAVPAAALSEEERRRLSEILSHSKEEDHA